MADASNTDSAEIWKDLPGYEGHIQVSSLGRFRELRVITETLINNGYKRLHFSVEGRRLQLSSHREVCRAFHGEPPHAKSHACHLNGDRLDNRPENIIWATPKVNASHKNAHGTDNRGERHNMAILTALDVMEIRRRVAAGQEPRFLAREYGVTRGHINDIAARRSWKHI